MIRRTKFRARARIASLAAVCVVLISGAVAADPRGPLDPINKIVPVMPAESGTNVDPDMGKYGEGMSKGEYLMERHAFLAQRRGPLPATGNPRAAAALEVKRRLEQIAGIQYGNPGAGVWTPFGPSPIPDGSTYERTDPTSGRVAALAIHPTNANIVYVGTAGGGVFRTLDGGATWKAIFDQAASLSIGALALSPANPNTLFVGTGEASSSCDGLGGVGWYRVENANTIPVLHGPFDDDGNLQRRSISKILPHPTDANRMLLSVSAGANGVGCRFETATVPLFRVDGILGAAPAFTPITGLPAETLGVSDIAFVGSALLAASVTDSWDDGGIFRTANPWVASGAVTWTMTYQSAGRVEFATAGTGPTPVVIAAMEVSERIDGTAGRTPGALARSTDGGQTWTRLSGISGFCGDQCWYDIAVAMHPTNTNTILVGGSAGDGTFGAAAMRRSTDGSTFPLSQKGLHADTHALAFAPSSPNTVWVGSDGGVWRSDDAGATWISRNTAGLSATQFQSVASHPIDGDIVIGGTQDNGTLIRSGGVWDSAEYGDGGYTQIDGGSGGHADMRLYHTFYNVSGSRIFYSRAKSLSDAKNDKWELIGCYNSKAANGIRCNVSALFYSPLVLGPGSPNTIYLGSSVLWRSDDGGDTHTEAGTVGSDIISSIAIGSSDQVRLVGTRGGKAWRTMSGGALADVTGPWQSAFVSAVAIDPNNSSIAYVGLSRYMGEPASQIWRTTNLSAASPTWVKAAGGMPDVPVNDIVIDPRDSAKLYAATDVGVFSTANSGTSWDPMPGMPIVSVYDLAVARAGTINQRLRAATHGRGIFERFIGQYTPVATITPPAVSYGKIKVGKTSWVETIVVQNTGNTKMSVSTADITTGQNDFEIVQNGCVAKPLNPGASCSIGVVFHPYGFNSRSGTLTINSNAPGSPHAVGLSGSGTTGPAPTLQLDRKLFKWEMLRTGLTKTQTFRIANGGDAPMTTQATRLVGSGVSQFRIASDGCANATLPPGGACSVRVTFAPGAVGSHSAGLAVPNSAGPDGLISFEATGSTPEAPALAVEPRSIDYGTRVVGATTLRTLTVRNRGTGSMNVYMTGFDGSSNGYSVVDDTCTDASVAPGRTCQYTIGFTAPYFGSYAGAVHLQSEGGNVTVPLTGGGDIQPRAATDVSPNLNEFGAQALGSASGGRAFRIVNDGTADLITTAVSLGEPHGSSFRIAAETCTAGPVAPGESCSVSVKFSPSSAGVKASSVVLTSNATNAAEMRVVGEAYSAGTPLVAASSGALHFAPQPIGSESGRQAITVTNTGSAAAILGLASLTGDDPDAFTVDHDGCSLQRLDPGATCTLGVRFAPEAEGEHMASVGITSSASPAPLHVLLYGSGEVVGVPSVSLYPSSLGFGSQIEGTSSAYRSLTLTNTGTGDVTVGVASVGGADAGDFGLIDYCTGATITPGDACSMYVSFSPRAVGARVGTLTVPTDAGNQLAALTGTGVESPVNPGVSMTPASLSFGFTKVGATSATQSITIRSTGSDPLRVDGIALAGGAHDQFVVMTDTCSGGTFSPGQQCSVSLRYRPDTAGTHAASLIVTTNAGSPTAALSGIADGAGPVSTFTHADPSILTRLSDQIRGESTDDHAIESVTVSYVNLLGAAEQVQATIVSCPIATRCTWRAALPTLPGIYTVVATATDKAGNAESPGPRITVVVI